MTQKMTEKERILELEKEVKKLKIKIEEIESWQRRSQSPLMPKQYDKRIWKVDLEKSKR